MATANQVCATILENVINSGLDFNINQTPYSIHFSLRKKYSKNSSNKIPLCSSPNTSLPQETQVDNFRQELLHTRNEYVKLYNMYEAEQEARSKLDEEYKELIKKLATEEKSVENVKAIKIDNKSLKEKLENKSLELRHLKTELENVKKEKMPILWPLRHLKLKSKNREKNLRRKILS